MRTICVFCGARSGVDPRYSETASNLGELIATSGRRLVFGGGDIGLMGAVSAAAHASGGAVVGVIPASLIDRELERSPEIALRVVRTMHERKAMMVELSDGFVALPGGFGTLDELFEILTWSQLGIHRKPVGLLNSGGFYDRLLAFLDSLVADGFLLGGHHELLIVDDDPASLLDRMDRWVAPDLARWADLDDV
ncbi:MAG TPA: TIGR00730 family Rossman fold protein [Thermomicrobiales bacterium]|nr:TIGR00730 family Rossman fold protein [Chloroflexota bacterium]HQX63344.1 TIGR00730 family Rossman fold protein [Thermomicrobiales bacterium]HQZ88861.1 TIGR00730 family Rossman fold protein [Thermomicrobiales bacterium]HRA31342.1 TIGR00730 family Rossman fold protein [Thermomicrobiales bacterium]